MRVFLPCRKGSERVPQKNVRPFASEPHGLLGIKLTQLLGVASIEEIILSSNDEDVFNIAKHYNDGRIQFDHRPESLARSSTSTDALIEYVPSIVSGGDVLWTHVTSPFCDASVYADAIQCYHDVQNQGFDSLMSVTELRKFLWNALGPVNYDAKKEKWPRTQTLEPLYEINSAFFIAPIACYQERKDRIGERPYLYKLNARQSFDVDWPEDFALAEKMWIHEKA
jgi:CMP-N-acetylneuraminic acid synthetase